MLRQKTKRREQKIGRDKEKHVVTVFRSTKEQEAGYNKFYVMTQDTPVATRTRLLYQNYVSTLSNSITIKSKKKLRKSVVTETASYDIS